MARYYGKFDAKKYWANKPYCVICKVHKVKDGKICRECEVKADFNESEMKVDIQKINKKDLVATFSAKEIERKPADTKLISLVGYLKDCAQALLRSVALTDITANNTSFIPLPPDTPRQACRK